MRFHYQCLFCSEQFKIYRGVLYDCQQLFFFIWFSSSLWWTYGSCYHKLNVLIYEIVGLLLSRVEGLVPRSPPDSGLMENMMWTNTCSVFTTDILYYGCMCSKFGRGELSWRGTEIVEESGETVPDCWSQPLTSSPLLFHYSCCITSTVSATS